MLLTVWKCVGIVFGILLIVIMIAIIWSILQAVLFGNKKDKKEK